MNKTLWLSCLLASSLFGCSTSNVTAPEPKPAMPPVNEVKEEPKEPPALDKGDNPKRIYQLRDFKTGSVTVGKHRFRVWLADDEGRIQEGMMWLKPTDVEDDQGMLFILPGKPENRRFWMRNCPMGLDLLFIGENKRIVNIGTGKPFDESGVESTGPASYVLELKVGTARKIGIKAGDLVEMKL